LIEIRDGEELAGVLPLFLERVGLSLARARVAKVVGSDHTIAMVDLPVLEEIAPEALALAARRLFEEDRADMIQVGPISATSPRLAPLRAAADVLSDRETGAHTLFELPDGFDGYLQGLSKNQRSNYKRNLNKLKKAFDFSVDTVPDGPELEPEFEAFVEMHQAQWRAVSKLGHYGDWPRSLEFTRDLVATLHDRVRLMRLVADGEVVSYYFSFEYDGTYYWRLPARLTGEEWDKFALGRVGLLKMFEEAAAEGVTAIEAGNGRYGYKEQLNAATIPLHSLVLCRKGLASRCRARLALALGEFLNLAYYRVWYLKVAPRLGVGRPLWRSWIRHRL
jgi:CelD/BcsL family acetyltransferase involved in cellulose biosynthesis